MKAKNLLKSLCASALFLLSTVTLSAENDSNLFYNSEVANGLKVAETIYKADGSGLANYMKYNYTYDEQNRLTMSEAMKWDAQSDQWQKDMCMRYAYEGNHITTTYDQWNEGKGQYILVPEMTVTMESTATAQ